MHFFCPQCWKEIDEKDRIYPYCGADILKHERKGFKEKLINALRHPEPETVKRAVWILGKIKSLKAIKVLIELFSKTDNPFLKREILEALSEIGTEESLAFIKRCLSSEIGIVRKKAEEIIISTKEAGDV